MSSPRKKAIMAMSGGVDSSVGVALLKEEGYEVEGVFMKLGIEGDEESEKSARAVADKLGIKFYTLDLSKEFKKKVIDYFVAEYKNGRTPNPCVMCNKEIKFGILMERVLKMGGDFMATGHYVCLKNVIARSPSERSPVPKFTNFRTGRSSREGDEAIPVRQLLDLWYGIAALRSFACWRIHSARNDGRGQIPKFKLLKAKDRNKDQSYFLYNLTQEKLKRCLFPLGKYAKIKVRKLAERYKLPVLERDESQEICFIKSKRYGDFLKKYLKLIPGDIVDTNNNRIGRHQGLPLYTIGQRREIGIGGTGPYYAVGMDFKNNKLLVSNNFNDPALYSKKLIAEKVNWIAGEIPKFPLKIKAKVRYRSKEASAVINREGKNKYQVIFKTPQRAITPGQSAVFYLKDEVVGGGVILKMP